MDREQLSALLDGECSDVELGRLLDAMDRDPALKDEWSRLCLSRDMGRGLSPTKTEVCICSGVMSAVQADKVVNIASRRQPMAWRPLLGMAAAASMAVVAVLVSVNFKNTSSTDNALAQAAPAAGQMLAGRDNYDDLDSYLIEHSNSVADQGMGAGALRYTRYAAHTAAYDTAGSR